MMKYRSRAYNIIINIVCTQVLRLEDDMSTNTCSIYVTSVHTRCLKHSTSVCVCVLYCRVLCETINTLCNIKLIGRIENNVRRDIVET